jgi:hypothetical protein
VKALSYIVARLQEPSSWAAIATILAGMGEVIPSDLWKHISMAGMGIAGAIAFFMKEKGAA